jgi:N-acyl-D-aspartate/D-glutamate deacylase
MYRLTDPIEWEPDESQRIAALAKAAGKSDEEYLYDFFVDTDGLGYIMAFANNYHFSNGDAIFDMLSDPISRVGLDDAGAHAKVICDATSPTLLLTHWTRDRKRGPKLPLEFAVKKATADLAQLFGLSDRGTIAAGKRADINVIDYDRLAIEQPRMAFDLPTGAARMLQGAKGYVATMVGGIVTREHDIDTGARPGRVIRTSGRGS